MAKRDKKAAKFNVDFFGRANTDDQKQIARAGRKIPKGQRELNHLLAIINVELQKLEQYKDVPANASPAHLLILNKFIELISRENKEKVSMTQCPHCGHKQFITCENDDCGRAYEIKLPSAQMEKNTIAALNKLSDKMFPNLQATSQDININATISSLQEASSYVILKYVPEDKQKEAASELMEKLLVAEVVNGEATTVE